MAIIEAKSVEDEEEVRKIPTPEEVDSSKVVEVYHIPPRSITIKEWEQLAEFSIKEDQVELDRNLASYIVFDISENHKRIIQHWMDIQETESGKKYVETFTTYFSIKDDVVSIENDHLDSDSFDIDISEITDLL
jgi:hypothetical protein